MFTTVWPYVLSDFKVHQKQSSQKYNKYAD